MSGYALAAIGAGIVVAVGVPLMERLLRWIRPLSPEQEEAEHFREQARRSTDRFRR
jgi:hypothetical protein